MNREDEGGKNSQYWAFK